MSRKCLERIGKDAHKAVTADCITTIGELYNRLQKEHRICQYCALEETMAAILGVIKPFLHAEQVSEIVGQAIANKYDVSVELEVQHLNYQMVEIEELEAILERVAARKRKH